LLLRLEIVKSGLLDGLHEAETLVLGILLDHLHNVDVLAVAHLHLLHLLDTPFQLFEVLLFEDFADVVVVR